MRGNTLRVCGCEPQREETPAYTNYIETMIVRLMGPPSAHWGRIADPHAIGHGGGRQAPRLDADNVAAALSPPTPLSMWFLSTNSRHPEEPVMAKAIRKGRSQCRCRIDAILNSIALAPCNTIAPNRCPSAGGRTGLQVSPTDSPVLSGFTANRFRLLWVVFSTSIQIGGSESLTGVLPEKNRAQRNFIWQPKRMANNTSAPSCKPPLVR